MKYIIDTQTNAMFTQIIGLTETLRGGEAPVIFQIRSHDTAMLRNMYSALQEVSQKLKEFDEKYHTHVTVASDYDYGCVVFRHGDVPITCIVQRQACTLIIGGRQFGTLPIDLTGMIKALEETGEHL